MRKRDLNQMIRSGMDPDDIDDELEEENANLRLPMFKRPRDRGNGSDQQDERPNALREVSRERRQRGRDDKNPDILQR